MNPSNPDVSPEAAAVLARLYAWSGNRVLSGQHNTPSAGARFSDQAFEITGRRPAIWGQDFGFAAEGQDGIGYRPAIIEEAKRKHAEGSIVTLMWHAVRPTQEEPGEFKGSVIARLTDEEWNDLFQGGTEIHERWARQVDIVAGFLAELRDARVPVLWRPYHEMNGSWFWWGGRPGEGGYPQLWRMLYDRLTRRHRLDNLLWVWNANAPRLDAAPYSEFFPGGDCVDVLASDVYGNDYAQTHHDDLLELAAGKPIALGEVGTAPTPEILRRQPKWVWFMIWSGFLTYDNTPESLRALFHDARTLNHPPL